MDAGVIVAIVVGALILIALLALIGRRGSERRKDTRRHEAGEIRREAEVGRAQADRTRAEADERAARARREEATAREQGARAEAQQRDARDRHLEAAELDPDVDAKEAADRYDREYAEGGPSRDARGDELEHHERTVSPDEEHERHLVQDEDGNVVRDEERREPRTQA
jgi:FtsZ-interacting cell division protein ZipA